MQKTDSKTLNFLRKNLVYIIIAFCVLAIGLSVTLMLVTGNKTDVNVEPDNPVINPSDDPTINPDDPSDPADPVDSKIVFIAPVENATSIGAYSTTMVWNGTLSRFSAHKAIDFFAAEGTDVLAVYDGTVEKIEKSVLTGFTVTINHGKGLKTVYNSLEENDLLKEGQAVKKGDVIGKVSLTNRQEYKDGAHLHFEVFENEVNVDPAKYLTLDLK